ncbi:MAG: rhomboid family intramembrane serine protease [Chitinispirillaceae bacterium]|nr:rhomboid family intramembrane serine protease [Chitinispirillaceae bacterium]
MFIIPFSTDVHDGRIRLAALEIIGLCLIVHIFVTVDNKRVERDIVKATQLWERERAEKMAADSTGVNAILEMEKMIENYTNKRIPESYKELQNRIKEVRKTSLIYRLGLVLSDFKLHALFTSMFTHAGWMHLIGNMFFFYVCGVAMEQYWGYWRFLIIYLGCGLAAHAAFAGMSFATNTFSSGIPLVGASGAIAGMMGAFVLTHFRVNVKLFYFIGFRGGVFELPAYAYLGFWFLEQIFYALMDTNHSSGVAYTAHIGGFVAGGVLGKLIKSEDDASVVNPPLAQRQRERAAEAGRSSFPRGFYHAPASDERTIEEIAEGERETPSVIATEKAGWEALERGDVAQARQRLSLAMNTSLQYPDQFRADFANLFTNLIKQRDRLQFSQNEYYQWGKRLDALKEYKFAIICFDFAAFRDENAHIQKNSLLEASRLRIKTGYQTGKVRRDMEYLLGIDPDGIAGSQAREMLGQLKESTRG